MLELSTNVDFSYKSISLSYVLVALLWQLSTYFLSLLISEGTNDSRIIFILATYVGYAINGGCMYSYMTTFWYILASLDQRFATINKCLR